MIKLSFRDTEASAETFSGQEVKSRFFRKAIKLCAKRLKNNFKKLLTNENRGSIISTKLNSKGYDEDGKVTKLSESRGVL